MQCLSMLDRGRGIPATTLSGKNYIVVVMILTYARQTSIKPAQCLIGNWVHIEMFRQYSMSDSPFVRIYYMYGLFRR